jgi:hypothetical protein
MAGGSLMSEKLLAAAWDSPAVWDITAFSDSYIDSTTTHSLLLRFLLAGFSLSKGSAPTRRHCSDTNSHGKGII